MPFNPNSNLGGGGGEKNTFPFFFFKNFPFFQKTNLDYKSNKMIIICRMQLINIGQNLLQFFMSISYDNYTR